MENLDRVHETYLLRNRLPISHEFFDTRSKKEIDIASKIREKNKIISLKNQKSQNKPKVLILKPIEKKN